ncbi:ribonuclease R [Blattabacterium cuenoti]|uniref:ribonuclease R n=1 Tax=Blattabacterium cuenoti TaxID=1653831 RepID=UPI00163CD619|nr:ribonuclease R [Blattabacterium cuenoti]
MKKKNKQKIYIKNNFVNGVINITNYGYAFVEVQGLKKDIFIPKHKTHHAIAGDLVCVKYCIHKSNNKIEGEVIKIIKRKRKYFVGILKIKPKYGVVIIHNNTIHIDILITKNQLQGYFNNEKVLVKLISWPEYSKHPLGKIIKTFGYFGEYNTELFSLLEEYNISYEFSNKVEKEAQKIAKDNQQDMKNRRDMRNINTFTIDPIDAKDFDDALSIRKLNYNIWEIGIHIADVTHYVKEGSILDKEAYNRATSIYLVGKVIPMLPKILSDNLCSLRPQQDKLSFSSIFNINKQGTILKSWFGKTIIRSNRRFTYEEVQKIIDEKKGEFSEEISTLFYLSKQLINKRLSNGSVILDKLELKFHLDQNNNPINIYFEKNKKAHSLIEEFMLLANNKISEFVSLTSQGLQSNNIYIYRVHEKPDMNKLLLLKRIIKPLGYTLNINKNNIKKSINKLLKSIHGTSQKNMIENLILRSMSKAKYTTKNIGHYGLSFLYYTHFTSPIRRYSDIMAHRLLNHYLLLNNIEKKTQLQSTEYYERKSIYCSNKERIAVDLEREFTKFLQVKYLQKFIGNTFEGIITGFTDWNIYIDLLLFQTEGIIRLKDITDDIYILHSDKYSITGEKTKKMFYLGDKILVKLKKVNLEKKQITLDWII